MSNIVEVRGASMPALQDIKELDNRIGAVVAKAFDMAQEDGIPMNIAVREQICATEWVCKHAPNQLDLVPKHYYADGVIARELFIPAGSFIVGKIHKHEHINFISKGKVSVVTEEGVSVIQGPCTMISPAGCKRVLFAHEDTVWTVIHKSDAQDEKSLEAEVIAPSYSSMGWYDPNDEELFKLLGGN